MKAENEMTLTFPSRSANEAFARAAVACFAAQLDPNLEELNDIKTAVSEAVTNCIVHAYRDTIGLVTIRCRILPDSVLDIVVRDKGCGMEDIEKARTPMFTTGGPERSGMGFTIMESFMTSLQVTSKPGRGTAQRREGVSSSCAPQTAAKSSQLAGNSTPAPPFLKSGDMPRRVSYQRQRLSSAGSVATRSAPEAKASAISPSPISRAAPRPRYRSAVAMA